MKKAKPLKNAHTANTKLGMGDFYGSGVKNPTGKMRSGAGRIEVTSKNLKKPPKSLA